MNHSWKTRVISMLLAVAMVFGMLPMAAFATDGEQGEITPTEADVQETTTELLPAEEEPVVAEYKVEHQVQNEDGTYSLSETETMTGNVGEQTAAAAKALEGYTAQSIAQTTIAADGSTVVVIKYDRVVEQTPATASYAVEHHLQNEDGSYSLSETETMTGNVGEETAAVAKTLEGYTAKSIEQTTISVDGTSVVRIYYDRVVTQTPAEDNQETSTAQYQVFHYLQTAEGYELDEDATEILTGNVGETTEAEAKEYDGYTAQPFEQTVIEASGTTVIEIRYDMDPVTADENSIMGVGLEGIGMTIITDKPSTLAPGVTMNEIVLFDKNGERVEMQLTTSDTSVETVKFYANYKDNQCASWGMQTLSEQVAAMEANYEEPFKVVAGLNASYYNVTNGAPTGAFVMEGVDVSSNGDGYAFFAVLKDGTVMIGDKGEYSKYKGQIKEAIGGYVHIVKDGAVVSGLDKVTKYPRQTIGITADGKVITMTADGSQAPKTIGLTYQEQAEVMLALGCVDALHLDGGNSATFGAVREGTDKFVTVNSPSGGAERAVSNTLMIVSTAVADGTFDHAVITGEYDYLLPNAVYTFSAFGVDASNAAAEIPETAVWTLSDNNFGTIDNGTFVSNGKLGNVDVQLSDNGKVVGSRTIHIVHPNTLSFDGEETTIPYGKSASLTVTAMYGNNKAFCTADMFDWSVDPAEAGTMDGFAFTAASESNISNAVVTAAYKYDTSVASASIKVKFGKGSEVLFDFEDGDISDWRGTESIHTWVDAEREKYPDATVKLMYPENYGNQIENVSSDVFLATEGNGGQVKSGNYSLGVKLNRLNAEGVGGWIYNYLFYTGETQIWRDVANGKSAVRVGMWVNMPQNATNTAFRICRTFTKDSSGKLYTNFDYMKSDYDGKNVSYNTNYGIPESGWVYIYFDLSSYDFQSSLQYNPNEDYAKNNGKADGNNIYPAFVQFINGTSADDDTMEELVLYIDDITLDFSDVTEDRDAPAITNVTVSSDTANFVALNGQTVNNNLLSFSAGVSDVSGNSNATGLNDSSAKIYIDGMDMSGKPGFKAAGGVMILNDVYLTNGSHSISFEISDKQGNVSRVTKGLTVAGSAANAKVYLAGHNDGNITPKAGSVYYIDVKASDASTIEAVNVTLKLNTANTFEYDYLVCAEGVAAVTSYDALNRELTLKLTHDGTQTGEAVLASVPVRVWAWDEEVTGVTASAQFASGAIPVINIECATTYGKVAYTDGAFSDYVAGFHDSLDVATELDNATAWHAHSEAAIADQNPDCTHTGYTGRTYCDGCKSVIDWGTTVAATGHTYEIGEDGILDCVCGKTFTGTHTDGKEYVDGICVADGWQGDVYYKDGVKLTGIQKVDGYYHDFGEDGVCENKVKYTGLFFDKAENVYRYSKMGVVTSGWQMIDDEWYYFEASTLAAATGTYQYTDDIVYEFEETGKLISGVWQKTLYGYRYYYGPGNHKFGWQTIDGNEYYFEDGYRVEGGWQLVVESQQYRNWYYFEDDGVCKDRSRKPADGFYTDRHGYAYAKDGKGLSGTLEIDGVYYSFTHDGYAQKNGTYGGRLFKDDYAAYTGLNNENGTLRYYRNGQPHMAGLIEFDGAYYFVNKGDGSIVTGKTTYVWKTNGIIPESDREFGADGKMLDGIVQKDDGYYYYDMGQPKMAGLIEIDGDYYFAKGDGKIVTDQVYYVWQGNGIVPESDREFGADGKMLNGIVKIDGGYYYYNMGKPEMAGLVEVDGHYYFARSADGKVITNQSYYVWKSNGLMPEGTYTFAEDGKMRDGIVQIDGGYYYFEGGKPKMAGLILIDGDYYFAKGDGVVITNQKYYVWQGNGLLPESEYWFGADGKMLNGVVKEENGYRYYDRGKPTMAGLIEFNGDYYFAKGDGVIITDQTYYVWQGNGIVPESERRFGADGKMFNGIVEIDGGYYYYNMGKSEMAGLIEVDGSYYFVRSADGKIVTDQKYYVWQGNGLLPESEYFFGADGKMLDGFVTKDDGIYYYEDGKIGTVGLNYIDGYYYFVGVDGKLVTDRTYYVWKTNGLTMAMNYTFDAQGRIVL